MKFRVGIAAMVVMASTTVAGCDLIESPAKVCAKDETVASIQGLIADQAAKIGDVGTEKDRRAAMDQIGLAKLLPFELITLKSSDKTTKLITCEAVLNMAVPKEEADFLAKNTDGLNGIAKSGEGRKSITYSRQPDAKGGGYVMTYKADDDVAALVSIIAQVHIQRLKPPEVQSAPVEVAPPPEAQSSAEPPAPASDTPPT